MADENAIPSKILTFAQGRRGSLVLVIDSPDHTASGKCWQFVEEALRQAGAMTSRDLARGRVLGKREAYVWGDPVALKDVIPGYILQFVGHVAHEDPRAGRPSRSASIP